MPIKVEDVFKDMDKLIEHYKITGREVSVLRLTPEQWERMSNDFQKALKAGNYSYPVQEVDGKPVYRGYKLVRHTI